MLSEDEIIEALTPILQDFTRSRLKEKHFGDFVIRKGYIKATTVGLNFHN